VLITNSEIWQAVIVFLVSNIVTAIVTRLIIRRKQSAVLVETLKQELRDERRNNSRREAIHEHKLSVYRTAAIGQRVRELFEESKKLPAPKLIVRR